VAAILAKKDNLGNENVIAYASRKLLDREQKWSSIERECLAIVFALTKWEHAKGVYPRLRLLQELGHDFELHSVQHESGCMFDARVLTASASLWQKLAF